MGCSIMQVNKIISRSLILLFISFSWHQASYSTEAFQTSVPRPLNVFYAGKPPEMDIETYNSLTCPEQKEERPILCQISTPQNNMEPGLFPLMIGYYEYSIKNYMINGELVDEVKNDEFYKSDYINFAQTQLENSYSLLILKNQASELDMTKKGYYLLSPNKKAIGAAFFNYQNVWNAANTEYLQNILKLKQIYPKKRGLRRKINLLFPDFPKGRMTNKYEFYSAQRNDGYSEIYVVLTPSKLNKFLVRKFDNVIGEKVIAAQIFVPQELIPKIAPYLRKQLLINDIKFNKFVRSRIKWMNS